MPRSLRLGVIVDSEAKLALIKTVAVQVGQKIECSVLVSANSGGVSPSELAQLETIQELDAWLVALNYADAQAAKTEQVLLSPSLASDIPVIVCDSSELSYGPVQQCQWLKRLKLRLQRVQGDVNLLSRRAASSVWLLAASTGGPSAVCEFLQALPSELDVAFVYLQHINQGYSSALISMLSKAGHYRPRLAHQGGVLEAGTVTLVDPAYRIEVQNNGTLVCFDDPWKGPYQPSIDQLAANVARTHSFRGGMIVFTGMGEDGVASSRLVAQQKGLVWVQKPETCVVDSMPQAVLQTGCAQFSGSPIELAQALSKHLHHLQEQQLNESSATY
ncbi:chemotaxis protein CheB [Gilvimarinus chinensis]|uniref:chemotaxis protein CheB n=1 Tax=Gilvimarinus chinensis TaxID=396005 RepID=UPI00036AC678|nr:chemotaxis protein CheB [Gilvimarinus chinensis]